METPNRYPQYHYMKVEEALAASILWYAYMRVLREEKPGQQRLNVKRMLRHAIDLVEGGYYNDAE